MKQNPPFLFRRNQDEGYLKNPSITLSDLESNKCKEGNLYKRGDGPSYAWQPRLFVLTFQQELYYFRPQEKKPRGCIHLRHYTFESHKDNDRELCFKLVPEHNNNNQRIWYFSAKSQADFDLWSNIIQDAIKGKSQSEAVHQIEQFLNQNSYNIPPSELEVEGTNNNDKNNNNILGSGASGIVKKGTCWKNTTTVAVKILNSSPEFIEKDELKDFYKEIELLSKLRHPNIVSMFGYCKKTWNNQDYICLVTEFVKGGNLSQCLHEERSLDLKLKFDLAISICTGMVYLHSQNVIHRDLKPQNILVENWNEAYLKVCDFGLSGILISEPSLTESSFDLNIGKYGTPSYAAPEITDEKHTNKIDVFSFAVVLWEIYTRKRPWEGINFGTEVANRVAKGERLKIPDDCPWKELIEKCWAQEPHNRPEFKAIFDELHQIKIKYIGADENSKEQKMLRAFKGKMTLPWKEFAVVVKDVMQVRPEKVEYLRFCLEQNGLVYKERWECFMQWFTPLVTYDEYHTSEKKGPEIELGYIFEEIVDIVSASWFYGFANADDAKAVLQNKPPGTFMFRFSGTPKKYTLSVTRPGGGVGHWRISCEKVNKGPAVLSIEGKKYGTFHEIVQTHEILPLISSVDKDVKVLLLQPCDRNKDVIPSEKK